MLIASIKRGDTVSNSDKNLGVKKGMISSWHDTDQHGPLNLGNDKGKMGRAYMNVIVPESFRENLIQAVEPVYGTPFINQEGDVETPIIRNKAQFLDLDRLGQDLKDPGMASRITTGEYMPLIDLVGMSSFRRRLKHSIKKDYKNLRVEPDKHVITIGTFTIAGGGTPDYAKIVNYIDDMSTQTGDIDGDYLGSTTETASIVCNHNTGGYEFSVIPDTVHGGDPTAGYTATFTNTSLGITLNMLNTTGYFVMKDMTIKSGANRGSNYLFQSALSNRSSKLRRIYCDGAGYTGSGLKLGRGSLDEHLISWDHSATGIFLGGNFTTVGRLLAYNCGTGINANNSATVLNSAALGNTTDWVVLAGLLDRCASSDATVTGTNSYPNLTTSDEIETDDTSVDFGRHKSGGSLEDNGSATTYDAVGFDGVTITSPFPINSFESAIAPVGSTAWHRTRINSAILAR